MTSDYVQLHYWQVGIAALLMLISGGISLVLGLGLERRLLVASIRTVVQLLLIGLVLRWIFTQTRWYYMLAMIVAMTLIAGVSAVRRTGRRYPRMWLDSVISMGLSSWVMAALAVTVIIRVGWDQPQYTIPLLGMILGNTLNGISLGVDRLGEELAGKRDQVETRLALGATRWEAARAAVQEAVRTGMTPTINAMMIVGVVSLPGMMTGQMLGGVPPVQAVMYQIVIMFLIAAGTSLGTLMIVLLAYRRLFTPDHQFLAELLVKRGNK
jgi:putative ABC transport system permease protein